MRPAIRQRVVLPARRSWLAPLHECGRSRTLRGQVRDVGKRHSSTRSTAAAPRGSREEAFEHPRRFTKLGYETSRLAVTVFAIAIPASPSKPRSSRRSDRRDTPQTFGGFDDRVAVAVTRRLQRESQRAASMRRYERHSRKLRRDSGATPTTTSRSSAAKPTAEPSWHRNRRLTAGVDIAVVVARVAARLHLYDGRPSSDLPMTCNGALRRDADEYRIGRRHSGSGSLCRSCTWRAIALRARCRRRCGRQPSSARPDRSTEE